MSFAASIKAFEEKAKLQMNKSVCTAIEFLGSQLITQTLNINIGGYSKGHIANNWRVSVGAPDMTLTPGGDMTGSASFARIRSILSSQAFLGKDNVVSVTNSVGYSYRASEIGWPMGKGTNNWNWTGNVPAYGFRGIALNNLKGKYI